MKSAHKFIGILIPVMVLFVFLAAVASPPAAQAQAVQVLSADPPSTEQGTVNLNVVIKGKGFKRGATAKFYKHDPAAPGSGIQVNSTTFNSSTEVVANIDVPVDAAVTTKFDIEVMNSDGRGGKGTELFSVTKKGQDASCTLPPPIPEGGLCLAGAPGSPACLDSSFGGGTGRVLGPRGMSFRGVTTHTVGGQQRIVAVGPEQTDPCAPAGSGIVRFRDDGTPDSSFGSGGVVKGLPLKVGEQSPIAVQLDNKLVVVGQASVQVPAPRGSKPLTVNVPAVARYSPDGLLDTTFGNAGLVTVPYGTLTGGLAAVALQSDGKIVAAGAYAAKLAVIRLNPNGTLDTSFNGTGLFVFSSNQSEANAIVIQRIGAEERIVVAGLMIRTYGYYTGAVVRLTSAGVLDNTFGANGLVEAVHPPLPGGAYNGGEFEGVAVDSSNRIVAAGNMNLYALQLARYDEFGNLDLTFGEGGYVLPPMQLNSEFASGIVIQPDGYLLTVGWSHPESDSRNALTLRRFTPNGTIDLSFGGAGWVLETFVNNGNASGYAISLQGDYKVIVAGIAPYISPYFGPALARYWTKAQPPPPQ